MPQMIFVSQPVPLTREDLATEGSRYGAPVAQLREHHRRIARMVASGLSNGEITTQTGITAHRISQLKRSPAFIDLVETYRADIDAAFIRGEDAYYSLLRENAFKAESLLTERLDAVLEPTEGIEPPQIATKDLLAITRDAADRLGYGKASQVTSITADFAALMEKALARSNKSKELTDARE